MLANRLKMAASTALGQYDTIDNVSVNMVADRRYDVSQGGTSLGHTDNGQMLPRLVNNVMVGSYVNAGTSSNNGQKRLVSEDFLTGTFFLSTKSRGQAANIFATNVTRTALAWSISCRYQLSGGFFWQIVESKALTIGVDEVVSVGAVVSTAPNTVVSDNGYKSMQFLKLVNGDPRFDADAKLASIYAMGDTGTSVANNDYYTPIELNKTTGTLTHPTGKQYQASAGNYKFAGSIFVHDDGHLIIYSWSGASTKQLIIRAIGGTNGVTSHNVASTELYMSLAAWHTVCKIPSIGLSAPTPDAVLYMMGVEVATNLVKADIISRSSNVHNSLALASTLTLSTATGNWLTARTSSISLDGIEKQVIWTADETAGKLLVLIVTHLGSGSISVEEVILTDLYAASTSAYRVSIIEVEDGTGFYISYMTGPAAYKSYFHKL